jgi:hypothetical protein
MNAPKARKQFRLVAAGTAFEAHFLPHPFIEFYKHSSSFP